MEIKVGPIAEYGKVVGWSAIKNGKICHGRTPEEAIEIMERILAGEEIEHFILE